ncbi:MAG: fatty acid hydroxylase family protein, partial [Rhodospirillales bacterium]|nr:fatty acid hydroxylase family protein [Rhodospirillales bacterium]
MAKKLIWGRAWHGRSYDLGKMTLAELWAAYLTYPAISLYAALAVASGAYALLTAWHWQQIVVPAVAVLLVYPVVWYGLHRFVLHGRWLYRMRWT